MGFDRRTTRVTVPNPAATATTTFNARSEWIRPITIKTLLTGTDTAVKLRLTDADSRIFYLDAADADYKTAAITNTLHMSDVETGLSITAFDAVGVAIPATQTAPTPVVRSPIEVAVVNGGTAGDVIDVTLDYEYGCFGAASFTLPTAASTTSTKTVALGAKFAQILGFKALSVGTSTTTHGRQDCVPRRR